MNPTDPRLPSLFLLPFVLVIVALFLFMALLFGQRDLTVLSLILLGIAAGAKLWSGWSLTGIECDARIDRSRVFPGEKIGFRASAKNGKFLPVWLRIHAPVKGLVRIDLPEAAVTAESGLLWYQKAEFRWELSPPCRGVHRIGPIGITSGDLFGFFPRQKETAETLEVVVYPRLVPLQPPAVPRRDLFGLPGAESPVQDPVYILGTREYQPGQPAKYIHWKATARHHKLQEKIFAPSTQEKVLLAVDVGPFAVQKAEEAFERMIETAASVAVRLAARGSAVGLATNGRMTGDYPSILSVTRNPRQLSALLEALARIRMEPDQDLVDKLRLHLKAPSGVTCLYFSLAEDETAVRARHYFTGRRIPFLFFAGRTFSGSTETEDPATGADGPMDRRMTAEDRV